MIVRDRNGDHREGLGIQFAESVMRARPLTFWSASRGVFHDDCLVDVDAIDEWT